MRISPAVNNSNIIRLSVILASLLLAGCSRCGSHAPKDQTLFKINNYSMTVDEFVREVNSDPSLTVSITGKKRTTGEILDDVIQKKSLLLEAQKEGLDKKRQFMDMVERFWEQSLLRAVVENKMKALSDNAGVGEEELKDRYLRMAQEIEADAALIKNEETAKKLTRSASPEDFLLSLKEAAPDVVEEIGTNIYSIDRETTFLEDFIFSVPPSMKSAYTKFRDGWLVVYIRARRPRDSRPFSEMRKEIKDILVREKAAAGFQKWAADLRKGSRVFINKKALDKIELKEAKY